MVGALAAMSFYQRRAGVGVIEEASRKAHDAFGGLTVPMAMTGIGLAVFVSRIVVLGAARAAMTSCPR